MSKLALGRLERSGVAGLCCVVCCALESCWVRIHFRLPYIDPACGVAISRMMPRYGLANCNPDTRSEDLAKTG